MTPWFEPHWSSTSVASMPADAWIVDLGNGNLITDMKDAEHSVRAARAAP